MIERLAHTVVGDEDIGPAIIVKIGKSDAEGFSARVGDPGFDADIFKRSIRFLVIKNIRDSLEIVGMTIGAQVRPEIAAKNRSSFKVPVEITRDEQIQSSIAIIINPARAG